MASVAMVLTACGGTADEAEDAGINQESAVTVAWEARSTSSTSARRTATRRRTPSSRTC
ncbi:hypothetical protein NKG05_23340 [Oerskovia sp. M15]